MFKNKIEEWASLRGLKHKYLAKRCEVSEQTFVSWVKNRTQPTLDKAFLLAEIFEISVDQLREESED